MHTNGAYGPVLLAEVLGDFVVCECIDFLTCLLSLFGNIETRLVMLIDEVAFSSCSVLFVSKGKMI